MKKIALLILVVVFASCHFCGSKVEFEIVNNTEFVIDSLNIVPNSEKPLKNITLKPYQKSMYVVDMSDIPPIDGSYNLSYKMNNEFVNKNYGYYSNGIPLEEYVVVTIEKDTVTFNPKEIE
ncbi:hypothetical protein [Tenacibaculum aiptasiae]|uniref:hypothetical protein n=1 Tax=Tenacibaculum aiptasiae TaxID=426481 RepID=UPI003B59BF8F